MQNQLRRRIARPIGYSEGWLPQGRMWGLYNDWRAVPVLLLPLLLLLLPPLLLPLQLLSLVLVLLLLKVAIACLLDAVPDAVKLVRGWHEAAGKRFYRRCATELHCHPCWSCGRM
mmetsp:Transcript_41597/g.115773  ORF Transcript_41597/g.115773 Transcript_41597/m.115773 type:complete len:115 (-) Transcript_41597:1751-2095(-)